MQEIILHLKIKIEGEEKCLTFVCPVPVFRSEMGSEFLKSDGVGESQEVK